jgi:hypothetical protein
MKCVVENRTGRVATSGDVHALATGGRAMALKVCREPGYAEAFEDLWTAVMSVQDL